MYKCTQFRSDLQKLIHDRMIDNQGVTIENSAWDMADQIEQAIASGSLTPQLKLNSTIEKNMGITEVRGAKTNISDLQVYGDGDTFALLCKASSQEQGWMKSTKVCNVPGGCIVQVTTQQKSSDGSYAVAEALTFVYGVWMDKDAEPRQLRAIKPKYDERCHGLGFEWEFAS